VKPWFLHSIDLASTSVNLLSDFSHTMVYHRCTIQWSEPFWEYESDEV